MVSQSISSHPTQFSAMDIKEQLASSMMNTRIKNYIDTAALPPSLVHVIIQSWNDHLRSIPFRFFFFGSMIKKDSRKPLQKCHSFRARWSVSLSCCTKSAMKERHHEHTSIAQALVLSVDLQFQILWTFLAGRILNCLHMAIVEH